MCCSTFWDLLWSFHGHLWCIFRDFLRTKYYAAPTRKLWGGTSSTCWRRWYFVRVFLSSFVQTNFVKTGDAQRVNNLSLAESNDLWDALKTRNCKLNAYWSIPENYLKFWSINSKLNPETQNLKHIPVRLFKKSQPGLCIQEPVEPFEKGMELEQLCMNIYRFTKPSNSRGSFIWSISGFIFLLTAQNSCARSIPLFRYTDPMAEREPQPSW